MWSHVLFGITHPLVLSYPGPRSAWADDFYREVRSYAASLGTNSAEWSTRNAMAMPMRESFSGGFLLPEEVRSKMVSTPSYSIQGHLWSCSSSLNSSKVALPSKNNLASCIFSIFTTHSSRPHLSIPRCSSSSGFPQNRHQNFKRCKWIYDSLLQNFQSFSCIIEYNPKCFPTYRHSCIECQQHSIWSARCEAHQLYLEPISPSSTNSS